MMNKTSVLFNMYPSEHCCGVYQVGHFEQRESNNIWGPISTKFKSLEEVFIDFEEQLFNDLFDEIREEGSATGGGYLLECSLVSKYTSNEPQHQQQLPELADYLLQSGWEIKNVFINRNTGNEVTTYSRLIIEEEILAYKSYFMGEEDNDDDNW